MLAGVARRMACACLAKWRRLRAKIEHFKALHGIKEIKIIGENESAVAAISASGMYAWPLKAKVYALSSPALQRAVISSAHQEEMH